MAISAAQGKLMAVIGDEVLIWLKFWQINIIVYFFQDTCVGFLLGGIGEMNKKREPNFLVVDKSKHFTLYQIFISNIYQDKVLYC